MSKQLVITTKSWQALIESLRANSKHDYNSLESLKHDGVYFTAVLCQDTDSAYTERLKIVTGDEEDTEYALEFLSLREKSVTLRPTPNGSELSKLIEQFVEPKEAVVTKIKRTRSKK